MGTEWSEPDPAYTGLKQWPASRTAVIQEALCIKSKVRSNVGSPATSETEAGGSFVYRTKSLVKTTLTKTRKLCEARAGWSESLTPAWSTREIQVSQRYIEKPCLKTTRFSNVGAGDSNSDHYAWVSRDLPREVSPQPSVAVLDQDLVTCCNT